MRTLAPLFAALLILAGMSFAPEARATANYEYKPNEYVQINGGLSPDGQYSIRAHGEGELGTDNFHLYLFDAKAGRKIGPIEDGRAGRHWNCSLLSVRKGGRS